MALALWDGKGGVMEVDVEAKYGSLWGGWCSESRRGPYG